MKNNLPIEYFTPEGYLQKPLQEILHKVFNFDSNGLQKSKYRSGIFWKDAITLFSQITVDKKAHQKMNLKKWIELIVHEQVHRDDMHLHPLKGLGFYTSYIIGFIIAGFSYRKNVFEKKAYKTAKTAKSLFDFQEKKLIQLLKNKSLCTEEAINDFTTKFLRFVKYEQL